ncbi:helix-turn-helix domain-containing protein [Pseudonocardia acaciae]|uniref:AraC-like ligand-binding domain-containing protein n=1 Tax=Pseudonocardia acaciae TaxID=551276 RepID=UPI000684C8FD|nr:helix-turn-helix domain-containing protein [Pseudonocardia acaciae]
MTSIARAERANHVKTSVIQEFDDFRNAVSASFVPLSVTSDRADNFWGRIRSCAVSEVSVTEINAAGHVVHRTPELIKQADRQYYKISLLLAGSGLLIQDNREALLRPGDLAIYDTRRPYSLIFERDFRTMVVMFPYHLIDLPADMIRQLTAVPISGREGLGNVVVPFLARIADNLEQLNGATGARLTHGALDLVTTLFASELDLGRAAEDPHHALMQRIRAYIDANLACTDLGPGQIAAAHYISTRHLHGIFREQGTTVSNWIRSRRLERCRRDLLDPVYANRPIAAIAAKWGFVDAAHFSRVFKAAFGRPPSDLRCNRLPSGG